jgi:hypothetical protein
MLLGGLVLTDSMNLDPLPALPLALAFGFNNAIPMPKV